MSSATAFHGVPATEVLSQASKASSGDTASLRVSVTVSVALRGPSVLLRFSLEVLSEVIEALGPAPLLAVNSSCHLFHRLGPERDQHRAALFPFRDEPCPLEQLQVLRHVIERQPANAAEIGTGEEILLVWFGWPSNRMSGIYTRVASKKAMAGKLGDLFQSNLSRTSY